MSLYTPKELDYINSEFERMLAVYMQSNPNGNEDVVRRAYAFALDAHNGMRRRSGEPYIFHPISVAMIVANEIGLGATSISCALLHDVVEDTQHTSEEIEALFGKKIASIVSGLTKLKGATTFQEKSLQAENFKKLLLTMSEDIRVILIKIADRLHNMRTLESMPARKQYRIAAETLYIYAPLAHRLGLFNIKQELEDLAFRYEQPEAYLSIFNTLEEAHTKRDELFNRFSEPIKTKLNSLGIEFEIKHRLKSVYSIYRKMQEKNVTIDSIFDITATRIIFEPQPNIAEKTQCWNIYSAITDIYRPRPDRLRDWVSTPKANGYEALHSTVMGPDGLWFEVQIRSRRMDEIAEKGYAAHWKYKSDTDANAKENELERWLKRLREFLDNPQADAIEFLDDFKTNLFATEIMVFTPKGEMKTMPTGSTILDLAYEIHTHLGTHCIGGKVNHKTVGLSYKLQSGDQVEILTSTKQQPREEWLDFVVTARAKAKLKDAFRDVRRTVIKAGELILQDTLTKLNLTDNSPTMKTLLAHFKIQKREELLFLIGKEKIDMAEINHLFIQSKPDRTLSQRLFSAFARSDKKVQPNKKPGITPGNREAIVISDDTSVFSFKVAACCNPIPGDPVIAYFDEQDQLILHHRKCDQAIELLATYGNRTTDAIWTSHKINAYVGTIKIDGLDRVGMLNDISAAISGTEKVNMRSVHIETDNGSFTGTISLSVFDTGALNGIIKKLLAVKGIQSVARIGHNNGSTL